jgi:lysophospholipase L1-like esterase
MWDANPALVKIGQISQLQQFMKDPGREEEFAAADAALAEAPDRVVFIGDSLIGGWPAQTDFFARHASYVNRGLSGDSTAQMLLRFQQDVVQLHPQVVVILGGTNDMNDVLGKHPASWVEYHIRSMVDIAKAEGITPVVCSVPPMARRPMSTVPASPEMHQEIAEVNAWIRQYTSAHSIRFVDFHSLFLNAQGIQRPDLTVDGVHPNAAGYRLMEPLVEMAIQEAQKAGGLKTEAAR